MILDSAGLLLASLLAFGTVPNYPPADPISAPGDTAVSVTVSWPMSRTHTIDSATDESRLTVYTDKEFNARSDDPRDSLRVNRSPTIAERERIAKQFADSLKCEVSVITLKVRNLPSSRGRCNLLTSYRYGVYRDGQFVPAYGLVNDLRVEPGTFELG